MEKIWQGLPPRKNRLMRIFITSLTMIFIAFGIYLQIKANIGLSPWNALNQGLSRTFPISYGTATILVSGAVLAIDLVLKEKVGFGTLLDSVLIGIFTDIFERIDPTPELESLWIKGIIFVMGLAVVCLGQYFYMSTALCCGARDSLTVALGKRFNKLSVGTINNLIFLTVLVFGWALGATVGLGTVLSVFGNGVLMDVIFRLVHFEPYKVQHEHFIATAITLVTGKEADEFI